MHKRKVIFALLPILILLGAVGGWAFWMTLGSGSASASVGSLTAPGKPNVPTTGAAVNLSWSAATVSGGGTVLYHVERRDEPGSTWTDVCLSSDAAPIAAMSCNDTPGSGTFVYRVTSRFASWHTTGDESDPVSGDASPFVISINRADPSPTNDSTLSWSVTFSEPVTGVDAADFALAASGVTGATISGVTGSGSVYTVTVTGATGDGTLGLNLDDDDTIEDSASNSLGSSGGGTNGDFTGQVYAVDNIGPSVTVEQAAGQVDPTNGSPINFTVVFSESTSNFATGDVTLSGAAGATTAIVSGSGTTYNVAVSGMTAQGSVIASIGAAAATDAAGNTNTGSTSTDNSVTYDTVAPSVTVEQAAGQVDPTNGSPINFTVVFSESTSNFATGDVTLSGAAGATAATVTGSGATYNVAVSGMASQGAVVASIGAGVATDAAGNTNTGSTSTDNSVTYDTVAPSVTVEQAAGQVDPTNGSPINFTVVFSESTSNFATGDVTLSGAAGATTAIVSGSGTTYNVAVSGMTAQGSVIASIGAAAATDAAGNTNTGSTSTDNSVTYDTVAPSVTVEQAAGQVDPTNGSPINFTVVFSESTSNFATGDVTLSGAAGATTAIVSGSGTTYNVAVSGMTAQGSVIASIGAAAATDAAGNTNTASSSTDNMVTYDTIAPTVTINQAGGQNDPTNASPINLTVVFSENTTNFATGDVALTGAAGATAATVTGSGATYNVAVSGMASQGAVVASIGAGVATDAAGNTNTGSTSTDNSVTYDTVAPSVTVEQAAGQADPTNGSPINFTVVFSENTTNFATGDVTLSGTAGATTATVTGSGATYNVAVSGMNANGTVIATIAAAQATDAAGNANTASTSTDNTVTFTINYTFLVSNPGARIAGTAFGGVTIQLQANGVNTPNLNGSPYTGAKPITFSGPGTSPGGTAPSYPATVTFTTGLATLPAGSITLFDAEATTLTASDNAPSPIVTGVSTSFTVNAAVATKMQLANCLNSSGASIACASSFTLGNAPSSVKANIEILDAYGNIPAATSVTITLTMTGATDRFTFGTPPTQVTVTTLSVTGTGSPVNRSSAQVTVNKIGNSGGTVTITGTAAGFTNLVYTVSK